MDITKSIEFCARLQSINAEKANLDEIVSHCRYEPNVEEGTFLSISSNASYERNVRSTYGITDKLTIEFTIFKPGIGETIEEVPLKQSFYKSNSEKSLFHIICSELLGENPRHGFALKDLLAKPCEVVVTHNTTDKGTFANITGIKRLFVDVDANLDHMVI